MFDTEDTICAIASAAGQAQRGIVRISGPNAAKCLEFLLTDPVDLQQVQQPTVLSSTVQIGEFPPCRAQLYFWPDHRSYTRQPSLEVHLPGAAPLLQAALNQFCQQPGERIRIAEPGEFTMRAFLAGRLDLTQAEAVLGVIDAADQQELAVALSQLAGGLNKDLQDLRNKMIELLAHLEAGLDFVEEDIQFISQEQLHRQVSAVAKQLETILSQLSSRLVQTSHVRIVLRGRPNVGKSSLLNALVEEEVAIVSDVAGTTRDYVTRQLNIGGIDCTLIDTAGVELTVEQLSAIESEAQAKTSRQSKISHVEIFCIDGSRELVAWETEQLQPAPQAMRVIVCTKCDLPGFIAHAMADVVTSHTPQGVVGLRNHLQSVLRQQATQGPVVQQTAARCFDSLETATQSVRRALELCERQWVEELIAAELRTALNQLGLVVGNVYTDDILDRIFSTFCIGK
ncbi:MAG: tRNA uridine-5-carboxymethylaminomethyl(34) synthesis GTPase MnmE [Planctomycetaceae bacterium]|nr:tRNA uridine-5-carboxymethylaminomethyl(34) synthesis GTPase MnmE [Planctomycetaceae bacterium]